MYGQDEEVEIFVGVEAPQIDEQIEELLKIQPIVYESELYGQRARKFRKSCRRISHKTLSQTLLQAIPGREREVGEVIRYIQNLKLGERTPLCLNGSTGCGKTSIIRELRRCLEADQSKFNVIYLNCMCISSVRNVYSSLMQELFGTYDKKPQAALNAKFQQPNQSNIINLVILDQIDQFLTAKNFIYNILEWVGTGKARLGVIMVSNMADLAVNLSQKLKSRLKFNTITFAPYRYDELIKILHHKYPIQIKMFTNDAIIYLCKKVASINSDVRLLEKYFNEALRTIEAQTIQIEHIANIFNPQQKTIRSILQPYQFVIDFLINSPKHKNISDDIKTYCFTRNINQFTQSQITNMLSQLEQMGLLLLRYDRAFQCDYRYRNYGINLTDFAYLLEATK